MIWVKNAVYIVLHAQNTHAENQFLLTKGEQN